MHKGINKQITHVKKK